MLKIVASFGLLLTLSISALAGGEQEKVLRSPKTECGIYLTRIPNREAGVEDTKGQRLVASTDPIEFEKFLDAQGDGLELPADAKLAVVGASWDKRTRAKAEEDLKEALRARGFENVPVQSIRQLTTWADQVQGVFQEVDGQWVRRSSAAPRDVKTAVDTGTIVDGLPTLIVGAPVLGKNADRYDDFLSHVFERAGFETTGDHLALPLTRQSTAGAMVSRALAHPIDFLAYLGKRARSLPLWGQDYQEPTRAERANALEKLIVPGGLTAMVMTIQSFFGGRPLSLVIPTTVINGANSYVTGRWRNTLQNWTRRSLAAFPDEFVKNLSLSIFFTADLYFLGDPANWSRVLDGGAWATLFATKWLSILFNASWRTPNGLVVASWERYAMEELGRTPNAVRQAGSAISKYTSYVMTQFFIFSIISSSSLFKVAMTPDGLGVFPDGPLPAGATQLMGFNVGHAAMAACGVASACISFARGPQTWIADLAVKVDAYEGRFLRWILRRGGEDR